MLRTSSSFCGKLVESNGQFKYDRYGGGLVKCNLIVIIKDEKGSRIEPFEAQGSLGKVRMK